MRVAAVLQGQLNTCCRSSRHRWPRRRRTQRHRSVWRLEWRCCDAAVSHRAGQLRRAAATAL